MNLTEVYLILTEQAAEASSMKEKIWKRIMAALKMTRIVGDTDKKCRKTTDI